MPEYDWSEEERSAAKERGWTGCRLWKRCGGERCKQDGAPWTPVSLPSASMLPQGVRAAARRISGCPERLPPRVWDAVRRWYDCRRGSGLPQPGHPMEQPAWLFQAFGILDGEWQLIELAMREEQRKRAEARAQSRR